MSNLNVNIYKTPKYYGGNYYSEGLSPVYDEKTKKKGYVDEEGNLRIPCIYGKAYSFKDGLALVQDYFSEKFGYINTNGKVVVPFVYSELGFFNEGLAKIQDPKTLLYGFIDTNGCNVIPCQFGYAIRFSEGLACVSSDKYGDLGYINTDGELVIPYKYAFYSDFSEGLACVGVEEKNKTGRKKVIYKFGYIDKNGNEVIPFIYGYGKAFREGRATVEDLNRGIYYVIDKKGNVIYSSKKDIDSFSCGLASVENPKGKIGYIDRDGHLAIPYIYDFRRPFTKGYVIQKTQDCEYMIIDTKGNVVKKGTNKREIYEAYDELIGRKRPTSDIVGYYYELEIRGENNTITQCYDSIDDLREALNNLKKLCSMLDKSIELTSLSEEEDNRSL